MGCCSILQGLLPTQGLTLGLLHCRQILYPLRKASNSIILKVLRKGSCKADWCLKYYGYYFLKGKTVVLEKTLESPLDCKEIKPVHPKGDQSWVFMGRTDVEAEAPILWPPDAKNWVIWKDPDVGKDWRWEEKAMTEDEMVGWHNWLNGHEFEETPGVGDGQVGLVCCSAWSRKESDMTEQLNWSELNL